MPRQGEKTSPLPLTANGTFEALLDYNWTAEAITNVP